MHHFSFVLAGGVLVAALGFGVPARAQIPFAVPPPGEPVATSPARGAEQDGGAERSERSRERWLLSIEGVTHAPVDLGFQLGLETPPGLRVFAGYGWVPGG